MSTNVGCWNVRICAGLGSWKQWSFNWMLLLTTNEGWLWGGVGWVSLEYICYGSVQYFCCTAQCLCVCWPQPLCLLQVVTSILYRHLHICSISRLITILAIATRCLYFSSYTTGGLSSVLNLLPLFSDLVTFQKLLGSFFSCFFLLCWHFLQAYWHWLQCIILAATV